MLGRNLITSAAGNAAEAVEELLVLSFYVVPGLKA